MFNSILLAGGKSSRMGQDKAELIIEGQSLLERAMLLLKSIGSEGILVSGREGFKDSVLDTLPHCGPPGGLYACLEFLLKNGKLDNTPLLVIPLDMPKLSADVVTILLNNMPGQEACHFEGEVFPCVVRASEQLRQHLQQLFKESHELGGKRSMRAVLEFCHSMQLPKRLVKEEVFRNINTSEDYQNTLSNN